MHFPKSSFRAFNPNIFERLVTRGQGEVQRAKKTYQVNLFVHIICFAQFPLVANPTLPSENTSIKLYIYNLMKLRLKEAESKSKLFFSPPKVQKTSAKQTKTSSNWLKSSSALHQCDGHDCQHSHPNSTFRRSASALTTKCCR